MKDLIERITPSLAEILVQSESGAWVKAGSGFAIGAEGLVATCHHVIPEHRPINVAINGSTETATVVAENARCDLVILRVPLTVRPLTLGRFGQVAVGDELFWCGFPLYTWLPSYHKGMVSYLGPIPFSVGELEGIQVDGTINKGNSGGPIIDPNDDAVVGVVSGTMGRLDESLNELRLNAQQVTGSVLLSGVDPLAAIIRVVEDMERFIQLGVGYGISVEYLSRLHARIT